MNIELSIVIVSYNSFTDLQRCLPTITEQSVDFSYEIIVVDNHGADGVANWLSVSYPNIILIVNPVNNGYAGGNNLGVQHARGKWVFLLNPDTELRKDSLAQLMKSARDLPDALLNPKLLNPDGTINACGNQMHFTGITTCRGLNQPFNTFTTLHTIPLLSGAAIIGRAEVFRRLGGFDERYFMYFEDTDFSLRARRQGIQLVCESRAEVVHHYTLSLSAGKFYFLERNRLLTFLKIFSRNTLRALLPALLLTELLTWVYGLRGWSFLKSRFRTYKYIWANRSLINQEHQHLTRQLANVSDTALLAGSELSLPFASLLPKPFSSVADAILTTMYRLLIPRRLR
ncbi:glycosyltransferase family 2 protein [Fibrisoma montanum]|uniref:Glycosyltransferase family 2 protein n=1 Tax=Fibrisoma montanum TaxID=2305895 RepID=A0A418M823_9BACT|nr:glycosyltransferase family 2 protein [Fibrisoma montanum]RIV22289.1 glycosyltransferase family 2 protein [Fibrisoma montanum]